MVPRSIQNQLTKTSVLSIAYFREYQATDFLQTPLLLGFLKEPTPSTPGFNQQERHPELELSLYSSDALILLKLRK